METFASRAKGKGHRAKGKTAQIRIPISWAHNIWTLAFVVLSLSVFSGCGSTPISYVHPTADLSYITTVAIVPFQNLTQERGAEGKMANMVAAEVLRRGAFDVVEFGEVIKVLREEGFRQEEGMINKNIAERAGKRLNVQAFITGSVQEYGLSRGGGNTYPEVSLSLSLVDAKSYKILWEATHSLKGGTVLDRLFGIGKKSPSDLSQELVAEMLDTIFGG